MRLHVVGDCKNNQTAEIVSSACRDFTKRGGGKAWSYTHAWRKVCKSAWDGVSILASVDKLKHGKKALEKGYAPAGVVDKFPQEKAFVESGVKWIPCPAQTKGVTCTQCKLCWNAEMLREQGAGIVFQKH